MSEPQSLCLLRLSAIGDVCHAVAMVQRIQQYRPELAITWIIGKVEYQLLQHLPGIEFIIFDKSQGKQAFSQLEERLNGRRFDTLLVMQVALRANLVAARIKAKTKVGFDWQRSKELHWLFCNKRIQPQAQAHVLDGFMGFAEALGVPSLTQTQELPQWEIPIPAAEQEQANGLKQALGEYVVICPSASKAERNWLPERYAEVALHLQAKGYAVVLCGGPGAGEKALAQQILTHAPAIDKNCVGETRLLELLAILAQATLVIAPDTGPAHMATTVRTPVLGLYAHSNPKRTGPYNNIHHVVSVYDDAIEEQKGKPWSQLKWGIRAKGSDLMQRISVAQVIDAVDKLLADANANVNAK